MKGRHKNGEFDLVERNGDLSNAIIKQFFEVGNSTD